MVDNVQSLIQPLAQANVPLVNNGNPNTVYNTPWTLGSTPSSTPNLSAVLGATESLPAVTLNREQWAPPTEGWANDLAGALTPIAQLPQGWDALIKQSAAATGQAPAGAAPAAPSWTMPSNLILGGNRKPAVNQQLYSSDPAYKAAWDELAAFHNYNPDRAFTRGEDVNKLYSHLSELYTKYKNQGVGGGSAAPAQGSSGAGAPAQQAAGPGVGGSESAADLGRTTEIIGRGGIDSAPATGWNAGSTNTQQTVSNLNNAVQNGINAIVNNSGNIAQFIDVITEPWLPGNIYMGETNKLNTANLVKALGNMVVPGLGSLAGLIATKIPDSVSKDSPLGKMRDFFIQGKMDEWANLITDDLKRDYDKVRKDTETKMSSGLAGGGGGGGGSEGGASFGGGGGWGFSGGWGGGGGSGAVGNITTGPVEQVAM